MRELTVLSGKGGTGKTSLVASFAALAENALVVDCDVDAPNLALVLKPELERTTSFVGGKLARIVPDRCEGCGRCVEVCRFGAISQNGAGKGAAPDRYAVDSVFCEGCAVCAELCPHEAIDMLPATNGQWFVSRTRHGPMVHAQLGIAEENSGKLVALLRREAKALAERQSLDRIICDGPPGIGCPAIASLSGADLALIIVEPTVSGLHDFERVVRLADHFGVPSLVCVNKSDINDNMTLKIEETATRLGAGTVGTVPYDDTVVGAQLQQTSVVEYADNATSTAIRAVWERVRARLDAGIASREPGCATP
jgi:MinD superfamily P-loop ATPase